MRRLVIALMTAGSLLVADATDAVDRRLDLAGEGSFLASDLARAVRELPAAERPGALVRIGARRLPASGEALRSFLDERDPTLVAAAIGALGVAWPTTLADAVAVRERIAAREPAIAEAACAFAALVGDDLAVPALIARLDGPTREAAARALLAITGQGFASATEWQDWLRSREQTVTGMIGNLRTAVESADPRRIEAAAVPLLGERRGASTIAALLIEAAEHPDPAVAEIAAAGLATCPGPVAACWRHERGSVPRREEAAAPTGIAPSDATPPRVVETGGGIGWPAFLVAAAVGFGLWRFGRQRRQPPAAEPMPEREAKKKPRISVTFTK